VDGGLIMSLGEWCTARGGGSVTLWTCLKANRRTRNERCLALFAEQRASGAARSDVSCSLLFDMQLLDRDGDDSVSHSEPRARPAKDIAGVRGDNPRQTRRLASGNERDGGDSVHEYHIHVPCTPSPDLSHAQAQFRA
jgi:hypothetical protein